MSPHSTSGARKLRDRCLAGFQTGVLGGATMLVYLAIDAVLHRQRILSPDIILGSAIYGNDAIWHGSVKVALAGAGFEILLAALAGILFALLTPWIRTLGFTAMLAGIAFALVWYTVWYTVLFPRLVPIIPMYTLRSSAIAAHLLFGLVLSRLPALLPEPEPAPAPAAGLPDEPSAGPSDEPPPAQEQTA